VDEQGKLKTVSPVCSSIPPNLRYRTRTLRWLVPIVAIVTGPAFFCSFATGQQSKPGEYQVKAVYLYNFGRFIQWPESATKDESFVICVLGEDPFGPVLDATLAGEAIENRKLIARRIANPRDAGACRILYISSSEARHIKEILIPLGKSAVLTVSDMPDFTSDGGMIQFVVTEKKVRFQVNLTAAEKAGLTFSSQLLKVATDIKKDSVDNGGNP
jgi:hypothetical protein